ncbi:hypothetical protein [Dyella sp.]|uniref:hypothetical protein n=1 Tax=Dyella sp. TaxID=1869338 RepID=UPI002ED6B248
MAVTRKGKSMKADANLFGHELFIAGHEHAKSIDVSRVLIAVIHEAARIEPDVINLLRWYVEDPIDSLGGRTAEQLVASGHGQLVVRFLRHINGRTCIVPPKANSALR